MPQAVSKIYKTLIFGGAVSLAVLDTTALVNEAIVRHGLTPVAAAALGRTMTATAYLASWLKEEGSALSVSVNGGGAGGKIGVCSDGGLNVRGFIEHPQVVLPPRADGKLDVGACVGKCGTLTVIRDDGSGIPVVGTSELVSGEIAEDFSAYFLTSEQRPTAVALGVKIAPDGSCAGAGGVFLQPLPGADEDTLIRTERAIAPYGALSSVIAERGAEGVLHDFGAEHSDVRDVRFRCHCSRGRAASAILAMGRKEAEEIVREEGKIVVHCHYCNTDHTFYGEDVDRLFGENS